LPRIDITRDQCKGCELCVHACPQGILGISKEINKKGYFFAQVVDAPRCIGCRMCAITCPDVAIAIGVHGTMYHYFTY